MIRLTSPAHGRLLTRPAEPDDLGALAGVLADRQFLADRLERQRRDEGVLLAAWEGEIAVGGMYIWLDKPEEPPLRAFIPDLPLFTHIEIREDRRGRGLGTELIRQGELLLVERGHEQVALAVEITNSAAGRLYERLGFREWDHGLVTCYADDLLPDGTPRPEICRIMVKNLGES